MKFRGLLIQNSTVFYNYEILEKFEAGIQLKGYEVKALRAGRGSLKGSYVTIKNREVFLVNFNIPPYQPKNQPKDYDPLRSRKLLLKRKEIDYLAGKIEEKGLTLVPLKVYSKKNLIKIEIALVKGLKKFEKREKIRKREFDKEKERVLKYKFSS